MTANDMSTQPLTNVLASPRAAADLLEIPELTVLGWIKQNRLRVTRIQGRDVVRLDRVAELAAGAENPCENSQKSVRGVGP